MAWAISAVVLLVIAAALGRIMRPVRGPLGILIDGRGRYSLLQFQLVLWTLVILSLVSGIFFGRLGDGVADPLGFSIPDEVLGLIGISVGSGLVAGAIKSSKDARPETAAKVAASNVLDPPRLGQIYSSRKRAPTRTRWSTSPSSRTSSSRSCW